MHGQVNVQWLDRSICGSVISVQEAAFCFCKMNLCVRLFVELESHITVRCAVYDCICEKDKSDLI